MYSSSASHFRSSPLNSFPVSPNSVAKPLNFIVLLNFFLQPNKTPLTTENTLPTFALTIVFIETAKGHYRRSRSAFRNTIVFLNSIYSTIRFHLLVCIYLYIFSLSSSSSFTATSVLLCNEGFSSGESRVLNFHSERSRTTEDFQHVGRNTWERLHGEMVLPMCFVFVYCCYYFMKGGEN